MSRARWAAWGLAASLSLTSGCLGLCNRPLFRPCCSGGACAPSCGECAPSCGECAGCAEGVPVSEGPVLPDYGVPAVGAPAVPAVPAVPPSVGPPPGAIPAPGLAPQPTVPPLSPPPDRLVPQPALPGVYRP
jgi:hypothetical protein